MTEPRGTIGNVVQNNQLTGIAMGYARSRSLCAAARLGVADALADGERPLDQLATLCQADPASLYRLLRAVASFGVVAETHPAHFILTPFGQPLRKDAPNSEWPAIIFWADLIADSWSYLTKCVRTGDTAMSLMESEGLPSPWSKDPNSGDIFRAVMGTAPVEDYMPIVRAWDFSGFSKVADLGGGGGSLISAILSAYPKLQGMLVDRPESIDHARPRFEAEGLTERCELLVADLCTAVPAGADVYLMKHVLHGYTDEEAIHVLRNVRSVLPPQGRLLIVEFVLPEIVDRADPQLEQRLMSDLNMLALTGGKERSLPEWKTLLEASGFNYQNIIPVSDGLVSIIEAA